MAVKILRNLLASHELCIARGYVIRHLHSGTNGSNWNIINDPLCMEVTKLLPLQLVDQKFCVIVI